MIHYTEQYFISPTHPITIALIGCGGTGSSVLTGLARLDAALIQLGHPGFFVRVYDPDVVEDHNVGRQMFSPYEVGHNKGTVLVGRLNRAFGLNWENVPEEYDEGDPNNLIITCVDEGKVRLHIAGLLKEGRSFQPEYQKYFYWLDFGNSRKSGQVVLGTLQEIKQSNKKGISSLPTIAELYPEELKKEEPQEPSCSLAVALDKQDLFINSTLANLGLNLLWTMFREMKIVYHGFFLNLESLQINPLKI